MASFPKKILAAAGKSIKTDLQLIGTLTFEAGDSEGKKPASVSLVAYTGGAMTPGGWDEKVIVDLRGASFAKAATPFIAEHDSKQRIGHSNEQAVIPYGKSVKFGEGKVAGPQILARGPISSNSESAKLFANDAANGFPFEVSIGARILKAEHLAEGKTATVNGNKVEGPLVIAREVVIRELSILTLGADGNTSVSIAASEELNMKFADYLTSIGLDASAVTDETRPGLEAAWKAAVKAAEDDAAYAAKEKAKSGKGKTGKAKIAASETEDDEDEPKDLQAAQREASAKEFERVGELQARMDLFPGVKQVKLAGAKESISVSSLLATAVRDKWNADQLELQLRRSDYPEPSRGPAIHSVDRTLDNKALECSLLRYAGMEDAGQNRFTGKKFGLTAYYDDKVMEASHGKQYAVGGSIQALLDLQIRAAGDYYPSTDRSSSDFVAQAVQSWQKTRLQAASSGFSIINVVQVLENVMHKQALSAFNAAETIWRFICGRRPLNDFRAHALYRLDYSGHFRKVAVDGQLKHVGMTDSKYTIAADTYGAMITIDRKTIKNDDLGLILSQASGIGSLGALRIEESVFVLLLSNPSSFFATGNGNLISGGTSVLGLAGLEIARVAFRNQVVNGKPVGVSPTIMVVGTTLETTANRLYAEERLGYTGTATDTPFINNPNKGLYRPYVSGYLNNTSITDQDGAAISGQSATQWYLFASPNAPQGSAITIGFMDGRDEPYFDQAETDFNVPGGIQFRSYLDWGVAMHVTQLALRSAGA